MPSRRQVYTPMADQGSAEVMGRQARDRPPKGVIDRPNWDIAPGAAEIACAGALSNSVELSIVYDDLNNSEKIQPDWPFTSTLYQSCPESLVCLPTTVTWVPFLICETDATSVLG